MASSIRVGIEELVSVDSYADAAVLMLCDQPHVDAGVISDRLQLTAPPDCRLSLRTYGGSFGVPALFSSTLFGELIRLEGRSGAKEIIKRHASEAHFLPFQGGEVDVDTPDDFSRALQKTTAVRMYVRLNLWMLIITESRRGPSLLRASLRLDCDDAQVTDQTMRGDDDRVVTRR